MVRTNQPVFMTIEDVKRNLALERRTLGIPLSNFQTAVLSKFQRQKPIHTNEKALFQKGELHPQYINKTKPITSLSGTLPSTRGLPIPPGLKKSILRPPGTVSPSAKKKVSIASEEIIPTTATGKSSSGLSSVGTVPLKSSDVEAPLPRRPLPSLSDTRKSSGVEAPLPRRPLPSLSDTRKSSGVAPSKVITSALPGGIPKKIPPKSIMTEVIPSTIKGLVARQQPITVEPAPVRKRAIVTQNTTQQGGQRLLPRVPLNPEIEEEVSRRKLEMQSQKSVLPSLQKSVLPSLQKEVRKAGEERTSIGGRSGEAIPRKATQEPSSRAMETEIKPRKMIITGVSRGNKVPSSSKISPQKSEREVVTRVASKGAVVGEGGFKSLLPLGLRPRVPVLGEAVQAVKPPEGGKIRMPSTSTVVSPQAKRDILIYPKPEVQPVKQTVKTSSDVMKILKRIDFSRLSGNNSTKGNGFYNTADVTEFARALNINISGKGKPEMVDEIIEIAGQMGYQL